MKWVAGLLVVATLVLLLGSIPFAVERAPYSTYNEGASGLGHLFGISGQKRNVTLDHAGTPTLLLHGALKDLDPDDHALLVIRPELAYGQNEADAVRAFLDAGGRALLADRHGSGRGLLAQLDLGVHIPDSGVWSTSFRDDPARPLAESTGAIPGLPDVVSLSRPRPVLGPGTPVLTSHPLTWLDTNHNGRPDLGEPRAAYAYALLVNVGAGQLLVVGDPDLFTRRHASDAATAADTFLHWLTDGRPLLVVDEGHRARADPIGLGPMLTGDTPAVTLAIGLTVATGALLWSVGFRLTRRTPRRPRRPFEDPTWDHLDRQMLSELPP